MGGTPKLQLPSWPSSASESSARSAQPSFHVAFVLAHASKVPLSTNRVSSRFLSSLLNLSCKQLNLSLKQLHHRLLLSRSNTPRRPNKLRWYQMQPTSEPAVNLTQRSSFRG